MPSRSLTAAGLVATIALLPVSAAAQKDAFVEAFIRFHSALAGTYGDEGAEVLAAFDRMAASLDAWEQSLRTAEAELKARGASTPAEFAVLYAEQGRYDDAIRAMNGAISAEPLRASLYAYQGLLQEASGRPSDAALTFAAAATTDPSDPIAAYLAASPWSSATRRENLQPFVAALAAADRRAQRYRAAIAQFTLISDLAAPVPMFSPAAYADGFALFIQGQYRQAVTHFRTALAADPLVIDPADRNVQARAGVAALREKRGAPAIERLEAAVAALPRSSEAHRLLGVARRAVGLLPESIRELEVAVELAPRDERARVTLGSTLTEAGRLTDAERVLRETVMALPASGQARWALADVYERLNRGPDAIAVLEEAASLTVVAGKTLLYERIATLAHRHSDHDLIISALSRRARLVPNEPSAHRDLGLYFARLGRHDEALIELLMTTLLGGEDARTLTAIGQIYLTAERLDDAERVLQRAVAADATDAQARYSLGATLIRLNRIPEGRRQLDEYRRLNDAKLKEHQRLLDKESNPGRVLR